MDTLFHMEALFPSSISPKIDSILHSHIYPQAAHVFRAVAKFRALLVDVILSMKRTTPPPRAGYCYRYRSSPALKGGKKKKRSKIASFVKLQFTSSSTRDSGLDGRYSYYDYSAAWSAVVPAAEQEEVRHGGGDDGTTECGYLCWLEEERSSTGDDAPAPGEGGDDADCDCDSDGDSAVNEIDRLAEKFIARFHAKFLLEKQESYRRYQEMMARSV